MVSIDSGGDASQTIRFPNWKFKTSVSKSDINDIRNPINELGKHSDDEWKIVVRIIGVREY